MKSRIATISILMCAPGVHGCADQAVDVTKISAPRPALMLNPKPIPSTPAGIETNTIGNRYVADLRNVCVARGRQITGLQSYARTVSKKKS